MVTSEIEVDNRKIFEGMELLEPTKRPKTEQSMPPALYYLLKGDGLSGFRFNGEKIEESKEPERYNIRLAVLKGRNSYPTVSQGYVFGMWNENEDPVAYMGIMSYGNEAVCQSPFESRDIFSTYPSYWYNGWEDLKIFARSLSTNSEGLVIGHAGLTGRTQLFAAAMEVLRVKHVDRVIFSGRNFIETIPAKLWGGSGRVSIGLGFCSPIDVISVSTTHGRMSRIDLLNESIVAPV
jgi:hypothetical protein